MPNWNGSKCSLVSLHGFVDCLVDLLAIVPRCSLALVSRLVSNTGAGWGMVTHHVDILQMSGDGYRLNNSRKTNPHQAIA